MNKGYTHLISNKIAKLQTGEIITADHFPKIPRATAITILNRMSVTTDTIFRLKRGLYSKATQTRFGKATSIPLEALTYEIENDDNKCFGGVFLFNQLGLTTQVPTVIEILNNKSSYNSKIGNTTIHYVRIRPKINKKTKIYIQILEIVKKINKIPDGEVNKAITWIKNKVSSLNSSELTKLVEVTKDYPPRVRAIIGNILMPIDNKLSILLKKTLNENSYYKVGNALVYLADIDEWSLKK